MRLIDEILLLKQGSQCFTVCVAEGKKREEEERERGGQIDVQKTYHSYFFFKLELFLKFKI